MYIRLFLVLFFSINVHADKIFLNESADPKSKCFPTTFPGMVMGYSDGNFQIMRELIGCPIVNTCSRYARNIENHGISHLVANISEKEVKSILINETTSHTCKPNINKINSYKPPNIQGNIFGNKLYTVQNSSTSDETLNDVISDNLDGLTLAIEYKVDDTDAGWTEATASGLHADSNIRFTVEDDFGIFSEKQRVIVPVGFNNTVYIEGILEREAPQSQYAMLDVVNIWEKIGSENKLTYDTKIVFQGACSSDQLNSWTLFNKTKDLLDVELISIELEDGIRSIHVARFGENCVDGVEFTFEASSMKKN